ncbi:site-specific tyrosine recombinase XerD [Desertivibrio insolitus]|uniref:site-specific tyrosine recombinase XerD n=1 Tax=Herbiconiux sp. SYSU D00978 TaxID=2812562 RepID=UPI001A95BFFB|nr:site-specific tyrosine recombinase XerD [Herbiconiux sp. SYSU D00978]
MSEVADAPARVSALARSVDRYLRHVAIERGLSANTVAAYRRDLGVYLEMLAADGIDSARDIRREHVTGFVTALRSRETPLSATSVARMLSSVRAFHRFLLAEGEVEADAAAEVRPPKLPSRLPKAISIEQMTALLEAAGGEDPQQLRDRALLELLYATGARVTEAVSLDVDDVLGDDGRASDLVRLTGKGNKQRIVPIGSYARDALETYLVRARPMLALQGPSTPALLLGMRGGRLSRQNAWLRIQEIAAAAKLDGHVSPHTFRHSFATHLLAGGADVRVVQELLGHSSVATTQIYTLVTADALRDVYTTSHPRARG